MTARIGDERGFTLVELLIAMALTAVGVAATMGVFGAAGRTTVISQNTEVGAQQAQAELDRLSKLKYGELALTSTPVTSANVKNPNYRVSGSNFNVRTGLTEALVTTAGDGATAKVDPGPTTFAVGQNGSTITGKIYRYVTWRDENCPATICDGTQNTKRVIVAVSLDPVANTVQRNPLWFSTVIATRAPRRPATRAPPEETGPGRASSRAHRSSTSTTRPAPARRGTTRVHGPRRAATTLATRPRSAPRASSNSTCANPDPMKQPDSMGTQPPPGNSSTPIYEYSADLAGDYLGGLAMMRKGTTCRTSYSSSEPPRTGHPARTSGRSMPGTRRSTPTSTSSGRATVSSGRRPSAASPGAGFLCATLIERRVERRRPLGHHGRLDHLRRLHLAHDSAPAELYLHRVPAGRHRRGQPARAGAAPARGVRAGHRAALRPPELPVPARGRDHDPDRRLTDALLPPTDR